MMAIFFYIDILQAKKEEYHKNINDQPIAKKERRGTRMEQMIVAERCYQEEYDLSNEIKKSLLSFLKRFWRFYLCWCITASIMGAVTFFANSNKSDTLESKELEAVKINQAAPDSKEIAGHDRKR